jgi:predicted double-glycine peptidase
VIGTAARAVARSKATARATAKPQATAKAEALAIAKRIARICLPALALGACASSLPSAGPGPRLPTSDAWAQVADVTLVRQLGRSDCGSAALATALSHFDPRTDPAELRKALGPTDPQGTQGIPAGRLRDLARARGLQAYVIEATLADLAHEIDRGRPVLVGLYRVVGDRGYPHYEVVTGINAQQRQVLLADPANGWRKEDLAEFVRRWTPARNLAVVMLGPGDA